MIKEIPNSRSGVAHNAQLGTIAIEEAISLFFVPDPSTASYILVVHPRRALFARRMSKAVCCRITVVCDEDATLDEWGLMVASTTMNAANKDGWYSDGSGK